MSERRPRLYELDILEAQRIADLATDAQNTRDLLLEEVPDAALGEPVPVRGAHNPAGEVVLNGLLASKPAFVALRAAITEMPRDIREKLWVLVQVGSGDAAAPEWDTVLAAAAEVNDNDIIETLVADADLHHHLRKGLYELGATAPPTDVG